MTSKYQQCLDALHSGNVELLLETLVADIKRKDDIIAALLAKLDADTGVTDTNYNTLDDAQ